MRGKIIGTIAAAAASAMLMSITASAEYYVETDKTDDVITASVIADGATISGIEFTVELPDGADVIDTKTIGGAFYNEDNGYFAWAGTEPPEDGTVVFSVEFTVDSDSSGELTVTPADGYEDDFSEAITVEIISEDDIDIETDDKISDADDTDTSETDENTSAPDDDTTGTQDSDVDGDSNDNSDDDTDTNPDTGVTPIFAVVAVAGAAAVVAVRCQPILPDTAS